MSTNKNKNGLIYSKSEIELKEKYKSFLLAVKENLLKEKPVPMRVMIYEHKLSDSAREALLKNSVISGTPRHYIWNEKDITNEKVDLFYHRVYALNQINQIKTLRNKLHKKDEEIILLKEKIKNLK